MFLLYISEYYFFFVGLV